MTLMKRLKRVLNGHGKEKNATTDNAVVVETPAIDVPSVLVPESNRAPEAAPAQDNAPQEAHPITSLGQILRVEQVTTCDFFVGDLFRRRFNTTGAPEWGKHYVAFYREGPGRFSTVGYVNYLKHDDSWLCGGLLSDERFYRRIPEHHRALVRAGGGIAETLLRESFKHLRDAPAIWGYVGDKKAEAVDLRAGFIHTWHDKVMVVWNRELPDEEKDARLRRVIDLGPF